MPSYVDALLTEAEAMVHRTDGRPMETVFLGGGTPSLLPPALLEKLLHGLHTHFLIPSGTEFTVEANPGTLTREWLEIAVSMGMNRLSMGMQAAQTELLKILGRVHQPSDVAESVALVRRAGIRNLSLDLMFGLPGQTRQQWRETLQTALSLEPEHLSCYGLIPEEGTPLLHDLEAGRLYLPAEDEERHMYDDTLEILHRHGFLQYEISNFARPGHSCRHNIGYWQQVPYIGLGASAASMLPDGHEEHRWTNPTTIPAYLSMVQSADWGQRESTRISAADARFETLMLGLRMTEGVSESSFAARHGVSLRDYCGSVLVSLEQRGLLSRVGDFWRLTRRGMDVQNAILVEIMEATE